MQGDRAPGQSGGIYGAAARIRAASAAAAAAGSSASVIARTTTTRRAPAAAQPRVGAEVKPGSRQPGTQLAGHAGGAQNASACARRFTSVRRFSQIAWIGVPGSDSSAVNSQRSASASSNPQSKSRVSVPCSPRMT
jgi:hypothetical protein